MKDQDFDTWLSLNFMRVGTLRNVTRLFFIIGFLHFIYFFFFSGWIWNMHEKGNYSMWNSMALLMKHPYRDLLPGDWLHFNNNVLPYCRRAYGEMYCLATKARWFSIALLMILPFIIPFVHHYFVFQDEKSIEESKLSRKSTSVKPSFETSSHKTEKTKSSKTSKPFKTSTVTHEEDPVYSQDTFNKKDLSSAGFKVVKKAKDD